MSEKLYSVVKIPKNFVYDFARKSVNKKMGIIKHDVLEEVPAECKIIFTGNLTQISKYLDCNKSKWTHKLINGTPITAPHKEINQKALVIFVLIVIAVGCYLYF